MNVNIYNTRDYENKRNWTIGENKPNSNPIKPNLKRAKMNVNLTLTKDYRKNGAFAVQKNKPNSNPISSKPKMSANAFLQKDYENETAFRLQKNKPKTNPISNPVKVFLNLPEILNQIERITSQLAKLGAWVSTGYSRIMVPFFARQKQARLILLTKSTNVENLLDLDHQQHTILSWSLNPPEVSSAFERNVPFPDERITAMQKCTEAGYPIRAVIMPIIPVEGWQKIYANFIENLLMSLPLERVTLGQICSYSAALKLTERKLGKNNPISSHLEKTKSNDGRVRFPIKLRIEVYRHLIDTIKKLKPELHIGLCMEEHQTFKALNMESAIGSCNCVI